MARVLAKVGDLEVIATDTVQYFGNEEIYIFPFDDDEDFKLRIQLIVSEEGSTSRTGYAVTEDDTATLVIERNFRHNNPIASGRRISIASDQEYKYYISHVVTLIGSFDKYTVALSYTILREPLHE